MSNYIYYNGELYHYGVKGMKWGERKVEKLNQKIKQQTAERKMLRQTKGVSSIEYRKKSEQLYLNKQRRDLEQAKLNNDNIAKTIAKGNLKEAKLSIRYGGPHAFNSSRLKKPIYGYDLSKDESEALNFKQAERNERISKAATVGKVAATTALAVLGPLAVTTVINQAIYYKKTGRFAKMKVGFDFKKWQWNSLLY